MLGAHATILGMSEKSVPEPTLHDVVGILHVVTNRLDTMDENLHTLNQRVDNLEVQVADIKETTEAIERAVDKDAVTLIAHERRISKLEAVSV